MRGLVIWLAMYMKLLYILDIGSINWHISYSITKWLLALRLLALFYIPYSKTLAVKILVNKDCRRFGKKFWQIEALGSFAIQLISHVLKHQLIDMIDSDWLYRIRLCCMCSSHWLLAHCFIDTPLVSTISMMPYMHSK